MKFGKIDIKDLEMTVYDKDTTAEAVILCDYGVFNESRMEYTRHCRIKILKKDGVRWANERVRSSRNILLKARTYNLENGEIVITKMKAESKFEEKVNSYLYATRFSLPNVKVGSVIEYQYTIPWIPYEWRFQQQIPVIWSEFRMQQNQYVKVQKNFFGYIPLTIIEDGRWVAKDMPAFRTEAYMNSYTNFITKFEFDIRKIEYPPKYEEYYYYTISYNGVYEDFTSTWEEVSEALVHNKLFGGKLETMLFLNKEAEKINELNLSDIDKAKYIFELIKTKFTWNESERKYAYSNLSYLYKDEHVGNSAEINLILIALLEKVGLNVKPVALSTRNNGLLSPVFPTLSKLNYTIAQLIIDNKQYLLDATDKLAPFGLLPKRCINGNAITVDENISSWIDLKATNNSAEVIYSKLNLKSDGEVNGDISFKFSNYAAYDFRKELETYTSQEEYIEDLEVHHKGLQINDYEINNINDVYRPVTTKYDVSFLNNANVIGDNIYINPMLFEKMDNNPFKIEERKYPVDYIHPIEKTYILNLSIPDGYLVEQCPKSVKVALPDNKGSFIYSIKNLGKSIQLTYKFSIKDVVILPTEYGYLKEFYNQIINKHSEMIVLKKSDV
ncbi:MAG: DUF3857 domain-containing protein [Bacteroidales bacterium]|nr:DUF3857 domain-containing protein [Bacteroidales bacterium]